MFIWNFIKNIICKCKCSCSSEDIKIEPFKCSIKDNELTTREENISQIPEDEFTCEDCFDIPEISELHSNSGEISMYCPQDTRDNIIETTAKDYLDALLENKKYENMKCLYIKTIGNATQECDNTSTKNSPLKFCIKCKLPICEKCCVYFHMEHEDYLIPINEKNYTCGKHPKEKTEKYCIDCEEIICKSDENHSEHATFNTNIYQKEIERYKKIIEEKNKKLFNMLKFYRLVILYGDDETKKKIIESIEKENKRNKFDVDLVLYNQNPIKVVEV